MMADAAEWLAEVMNDHLAEEVTYTRGGSTLTGIKDTHGRQPLRIMDDYGARVEFDNVDHLIDVAAIDFGDGPTEPLPGDEIRVTAGNAVLVYGVMAPQGESVFRPADSYGIKLRIHSKQIGTE